MLYDQYGNKIDTAKLKQAEAVRVIPGVRDVSSSYPSNGLVPQRLARILRNADNGDITAYMELAEEMEEKEMQYASGSFDPQARRRPTGNHGQARRRFRNRP